MADTVKYANLILEVTQINISIVETLLLEIETGVFDISARTH